MSNPGRILYVTACVAILVLWLIYGGFEAAEAPYVGF